MANEPTAAEKALQEQVDSLTKENKTLKAAEKAKDDEIKKLKDSDAKNSKEIGELKEKTSKSDEELEKVQKEFEDYKSAHQGSIDESQELIIKKREEVQAMIKNRALIKEKLIEFSKFIEDALK